MQINNNLILLNDKAIKQNKRLLYLYEAREYQFMNDNLYDEKVSAILKDSENTLHLQDTRNPLIKNIVIISLIIVAIVIAGFIGFKMVSAKKSQANTNASLESALEASTVLANSYVYVDPIVVNLASVEKKTKYLRLTIVLKTSSADEAKIIKAKLPMIVDSFQSFLAGLRDTDFNGTAIAVLMKEELMKRANKLSSPIPITDVLFKEIMIN